MTATFDLAAVAPDASPASLDGLELAPQAQDLLFREARTANSFTDEPVTDEQVRAIYELVKWAPTSMNTQPLRVTLVRSQEARDRLVSHMAPGNQAKTAAAPLVAVLTAHRDFHENMPQLFPHTTPRPRTPSPTRPVASPSRPSTGPCRWATSSSACAPRDWPPAR